MWWLALMACVIDQDLYAERLKALSLVDADGDGHFSDVDCDDSDASVFPGAVERCDGLDNDCDGAADEELPRWYLDSDLDGYGYDGAYIDGCEQPESYAEFAGDCHDGDPSVHPDADERCNGADDDCDGSIDEDAVDGFPWYPDGDNDGLGVEGEAVNDCVQPSGYAGNTDDCDDGDASLPATWYYDGDGDGWGMQTRDILSCDSPTGYAPYRTEGFDCDDTNEAFHPRAPERMDGLDQNCNGVEDVWDWDAMIIPVTGFFPMGSPDGEPGRDNDEAQHRVTLSIPYAISVTEVTWRLYTQFTGTSLADSCPECPVTGVNWHEAAYFTNLLSTAYALENCYSCSTLGGLNCRMEIDKKIIDCQGFRLPTEAEWEYAARAYTTSPFHWGPLPLGHEFDCDNPINFGALGALHDYAHYCMNADRMQPVASLLPNGWGLYDMSGNAEEWVHDTWYVSDGGEETNPEYWQFHQTSNVVKGGWYDSEPHDLRHAARRPVTRFSSSGEAHSVGFRIARYTR